MAKPKTLKPLTDAELRAPVSKANFFRRGEHFIALTRNIGDVPTITFNPLNPSKEWQEWREYFERHLQWVPQVMRNMIDQAPGASLAMTVPSQWPSQFDTAFLSNKNWKPVPPRLVTPREHRETISELQQRFGIDWGIKRMPGPLRPKKAWTPPTNDELRAKYGRRHDDPPEDKPIEF